MNISGNIKVSKAILRLYFNLLSGGSSRAASRKHENKHPLIFSDFTSKNICPVLLGDREFDL